eukprot:TRINITY_DN7281_c0_g1_i2.p1 TRINITY_DN7281_c0_g1~~TRINITY_DN7281_c0_g1_i2.p1  ORF type:complete len:756 (+),score=186.45 TRINITY_DN7281_c0_g1_i2:236-2269(+)
MKVETEDAEAEAAALDNYAVEAPPALIEQLQNEVSDNFNKLQSLARDLNIQLPTPEIVFLGPKGHGKTALIEALLGHPLNLSAEGTCRPVHINIANNQACARPRITVRRDSILKEFADGDVEVPAEKLPELIEQRNKATDAPIVVTYETVAFANMTLIDLPGLCVDPSDTHANQIEQLVLQNMQPANRFLVVVRPSADTALPLDSDYVLDLVRRCDPDLSRTTLVYTRLYSHLKTFQSAKEVNRFLQGAVPDTKPHFVTLPPRGLRAKGTATSALPLRLLQASRRDTQLLEQLHYDKRAQRCVGVPRLLAALSECVVSTHRSAAPSVLAALRARRSEAEERLQRVDTERALLIAPEMRAAASDYAVEFVQVIERLIMGTAEGVPAVNGQTLEQEKLACGVGGQWADGTGAAIAVDPAGWGVPYWQHKLYGGQQFERLLSEYRAVSEHTALVDITADDVATAAGIPKLHNVPNYLWAASDLARQKSQEALQPLLSQLADRASFIMKRLSAVADTVAASRRRADLAPPAEGIRAEEYPFFVSFVRHLYYGEVEALLKSCKEKCLAEFYSTRTIYWDLTENMQESAVSAEDVATLAKSLFARIRTRVTDNVVLLFYDRFLVPLCSQLWANVHSRVAALPDSELTSLFEVRSQCAHTRNTHHRPKCPQSGRWRHARRCKHR